jgi:hypothetical protein
MRTILRAEVAGAIKIDRPDGRTADQTVGDDVLAEISRKVLWREGTAPCLAAAIGRARGRNGKPCPVRTVERYLGGHRDWSDEALAVIIAEIMRRHLARE